MRTHTVLSAVPGPVLEQARFDGRLCAQDIWRENKYQSWWGMIAALAGALVSGYLIRSAWVRMAPGVTAGRG